MQEERDAWVHTVSSAPFKQVERAVCGFVV